MTTSLPSTEFTYSRAHFKEIQKRFFALTGITLSDSKDAMVYSRLARRLRKLGLASFSDYLDLINYDKVEEVAFTNALTTNLTSFFREPHHFEQLKHYLKAAQRPISIWCAACSTGEEVYSIAMTVVDALGKGAKDISITASDIDSDVLRRAQSGIFDIERISNLSVQQKRQYFYRGKGENEGKVKVNPELTNMINFKKISLVEPFWPIKGKQDIVFCRNVMIYFNRDTQEKVIARIINKLKPGGLYFAGHSESFASLPNELKNVGRTAYQKIEGLR